jgi:uncharacterized Zn finger protein
MSWDDYPKARPRRADGIVAASKRGAIGASWWSQRFLTVLEGFGLGSRLTRGRSYARSGQVLDFVVRPGEILASVQGSQRDPYHVSLSINVFQPEQWSRIERRLAKSARYCAELLAGRMPQDIEAVFADSNLTLFPTSREFDTDCSCPDWQNPCKHIAAVCYILAESFDADPFQILAWRGRERAALLRRVETYRDDAAWEQAERTDPAQPPLADLVSTFWDCPAPLPGTGPAPAASAPAAAPVGAILDRLGPTGIELRGHDLADLLRPAYEAMARR